MIDVPAQTAEAEWPGIFVTLGLLRWVVESSYVGGIKCPSRFASHQSNLRSLPHTSEVSRTVGNSSQRHFARHFIPEDSSMGTYVVSICAMLFAGCAFAQQDTPAVYPM